LSDAEYDGEKHHDEESKLNEIKEETDPLKEQ
jgi:hypothetical protein